MTKGYVYAVRLPGAHEVKIGRTKKPPEQRCKELSGTNMTEQFTLEYALSVSDPQAVEKVAHTLLADYRVLKNREFFRCSRRQAKAAIRNAAVEVRSRWLPQSIQRFISAMQGVLVALLILLLAGICLIVADALDSGESANHTLQLTASAAITLVIQTLP